MQFFRGLSSIALVALALFVALQLSLQGWGLVDLSRRKVDGGTNKWPWVLVIIVGGIVGAVIYLAVGRKIFRDVADRAQERAMHSHEEPARSEALDRLYGNRDG